LRPFDRLRRNRRFSRRGLRALLGRDRLNGLCLRRRFLLRHLRRRLAGCQLHLFWQRGCGARLLLHFFTFAARFMRRGLHRLLLARRRRQAGRRGGAERDLDRHHFDADTRHRLGPMPERRQQRGVQRERSNEQCSASTEA
jgi:hypothetical protein